MKKHKSLSQLLKNKSLMKPSMDDEALEKKTKDFQLELIKIQQGLFHKRERVIILFEGFDAAGKGGAIRRITEPLDPRSIKVVPIAAPKRIEQGKHYLYRFWKKLPAPGRIVIFDRSWYGRLLVEKVEELTSKERLKDAYEEINQFEEMLLRDGIKLIKIFLAISKDEQLERFEARLEDPYKQWKIPMEDIQARQKWDKYVDAMDHILKHNDTKKSSWHIIPANSKKFARQEVLRILNEELHYAKKWIEKTPKLDQKKLAKLLRES